MAFVAGAPGTDQPRYDTSLPSSDAAVLEPVSGAVNARSEVHRAHTTVCGARSALHPTTGRHQHGHRSRQQDRALVVRDSRSGSGMSSPHPRLRSVIVCLVVTAALGLLYLALSEVFGWTAHPDLVWLGILVIVFGGAVVENAIRFDGLGDRQIESDRKTVGQVSNDGPAFGSGLPA